MDETTTEHWRWIPGYANRYEVSDSGRVRSHLTPYPGYHGELPRLLSVTKTSSTGRMATSLRLVMESSESSKSTGLFFWRSRDLAPKGWRHVTTMVIRRTTAFQI